MPLYEIEKKEIVGRSGSGNMVIRGEYINPPFASGADYAKKVYVRRNPKIAEAIQQAEGELDFTSSYAHF